ncbi:MAG: beta-lactamase family protein [Deltaproteobacteria bacterium]|nr:beta-lactamase family protein [Deltaproteobacteria bacterium]MBT8480385.1 beta-lactamase family protein [Deltaproteobacteria bacterium]NNK07600.1 beta-lactamase family protein [Myxococcales bacterium]NNK44781.1 beta-lactamase family protein [Myxococcales bacterium]NNL23250.1 beta-lactamase family protein [Myxococcales bacterium]
MPTKIEIHGVYEPRFEPVARLMRKQIKHYGGGAAAAVFLAGRPVVDIWAGRGRKDGTPWRHDTMSICYSGTKGITSTAVHMLAADGLIDYEAPVADYWPEFGCNGKQQITVRQLLSHQAGLHRLVHLIDELPEILDWDLIVSRLAKAEPDFQPGTANAYQAVTFGWLVGELIRRVSGLTVPEFIDRRIVQPLQLDGLYIGGADTQMDRLPDFVGLPELQRSGAEQLCIDYRVPFWVRSKTMRDLCRRGLTPRNGKALFSHPAFWGACLPALNGVATARSLAKMYAPLSMGGELDGVRLVSEEVIRKASEVQTKRADRVVLYPLHWKLGYHRTDAFLLDVPEAFGHFGLGGAGGWANPEHKLSFAFLHSGFPLTVIGQTRTVMMTAAVYESLGVYKGLWHTLRHGPVVDLVPKRS